MPDFLDAMTLPTLCVGSPDGVFRDRDSGLAVVVADGVPRPLGCLPADDEALLGTTAWGDRKGVLGLGDLREIDLSAIYPQVTVDDQGSTNSCAGHAAETIFSYAWLQGGLFFKRFSPTYLYGLANGDRDGGAVLAKVMKALSLYGIAGEELVPEGMIFRSQFPQNAYANARRHKPVEILSCRSFEDIVEALSGGFPVCSGIYVDTNFVAGRLDADGVAPAGGQVVGGHALAHVGLKWSARWGEWLVKTQNSWGVRWGMKGFCWLRKLHWDNMQIDAHAAIGVQNDAEDDRDDLPVAL